MTHRLYFGNLSWNTTEEALRDVVAQEGRTVSAVDIKTDPRSGRSRGFAFVDLGSDEEALAAVASLNGVELDGRTIKVSDAREQQVRTGGYGRTGGGRGGESGGRRGGGGGRRW